MNGVKGVKSIGFQTAKENIIFSFKNIFFLKVFRFYKSATCSFEPTFHVEIQTYPKTRTLYHENKILQVRPLSLNPFRTIRQ